MVSHAVWKTWPSGLSDEKTMAEGLDFCLLSPSGHVFHTAWDTMIKSYNNGMRCTAFYVHVIHCDLNWKDGHSSLCWAHFTNMDNLNTNMETVITTIIKCGNKLLIHSQNLTGQPL